MSDAPIISLAVFSTMRRLENHVRQPFPEVRGAPMPEETARKINDAMRASKEAGLKKEFIKVYAIDERRKAKERKERAEIDLRIMARAKHLTRDEE